MDNKQYRNKQKLEEAYDRLDSQYKVADEFGCSPATIQRWMVKHNIKAENSYPDKIEVNCDNPDCGDVIKKKPCLEEASKNHFCNRDCKANWQEDNLEGKNNPFWKEPEEMDCEWCDSSFEFKPKNKEERRFCSLECANEWKSANLLGQEREHWTGNTDKLKYGSNWWKVREKVIDRDSVCRICGHDGSERRHEVHHIKPIRTFENPEEANTTDNLILLCSYCHRQVENNMQTHPDI